MSYFRNKFHRDFLPTPLDFYRQELERLKIRGQWGQGLCPFHEEKNPSFSVNLQTGFFKCHSCGAKGPDIIAFQQQRYHQDFKEAAQSLGAWEDGDL